MEIDLREDFKAMILQDVKTDDFLNVSSGTPEEQIILKYFEFQRKLSFAGPHKVKESQEFECPEECKGGLEKLMGIFREGGDIRPYLNRTSANLNEYDDMFADWGILHFHLGSYIPEGDTFVERGKYVLFAYLHDETVYIIDIYDHDHWADTDVLQVIYNNWPEIIEPYIMPGVESPNVLIGYKERIKLRKVGIVTMIALKNSAGENFTIIPPTLGQTAARTSIVDTNNYQIEMNRLFKIEKQIIKHKEEFVKKYKLVDDNLSIRLKRITLDKIELIEEISEKMFSIDLY